VSDFDEFAEVVGSDPIPEYILVRVRHPWGMYTKEVICPDGTRIPHDKKHMAQHTELQREVRRKKAKWTVREIKLRKDECLRMAQEDAKMREVLSHQKRYRG